MNNPGAFKEWLLAMLQVWWGWLPSSFLAGVMAYGHNFLGWPTGPKYYVTFLFIGFLCSSFTAWRKEWIENRNGPEIVISWEASRSHGRASGIRCRNVGKASAFNIVVAGFSWPELSWHMPIQIPAVHPGGEGVWMETQFVEKPASDARDMDFLPLVLRKDIYKNREPLTLNVTFSDVNRTEFRRTFIILPIAKTEGVRILIGHLKIKRP
jgi:hypothetical protein